MKNKSLTILYLLIFLFSVQLYAHPHLYIDMSIELDIDDFGIKGFWQNWTILRKFGENIAIEYDKNKDNLFDSEETALIQQDVFQNIGIYNYYTHISIDSIEYHPGEIRNFSAEKFSNKTKYRFYVPCRIKAEERKKDVNITVYDESRYVSFGLMQVSDPSDENIEYSLEIAHNDNIYSHSNLWGTAIIEIFMGLSGEGLTNTAPFPLEKNNLFVTNVENSRLQATVDNPFTTTGTNLNDGTGNPFF